MKVLVTGSAGFIGSALSLRLLERGDQVVGVDNLNDYYDVSLKEARLARTQDHPNFTEVREDIADRAAMERVFRERREQSRDTHAMTETQTEPSTETRRFETEVSQLLQLMIHSLYSNREIFLRELISNGADACDKLRFEALAQPDAIPQPAELVIDVEVDAEARTVTVRDNGIGMSRDEVVEHIGTIARSGTKAFLEKLTGDQKKDSQLIGQFGVGFYSSFIVADHVRLETRRAGSEQDAGTRWESRGDGEYTITPCERTEAGTEITLTLKEDAGEFLEPVRLRHIIGRYSDHVAFPIRMRKQDEEGNPTDDWETVNRASALWTRSKSEISDEEYREFYKHVAHDFEDPAAWTHNHVEGRQEYTTLFYIPKRAPFDLWDRDARHGVKLYVKRVFIMDDADKLLPNYLRFVRGVVDSADLPLNVSREILQDNRLVDSIRSGSVKKILGLLESIAKNEPEAYAEIWQNFGRVLKEGPGEDFANQERSPSCCALPAPITATTPRTSRWRITSSA